MRTIKFRGQTKTVNGKEWIYGYCYKVKSFFNEGYQWFIRDDHILDSAIIEETLGQYTGLKDKNGKEIYEGDVVSLQFDLSSQVSKVVWLQDISGFIIENVSILDKDLAERIVVIGNIYENKDLLEKGKEE